MFNSEGKSTLYYYGDPHLETITDIKSRWSRAQVYSTILNDHAGSHFVDPEFPLNEDSIGDHKNLFDWADKSMLKEKKEWQNGGWDNTATWIRIQDLCNILHPDGTMVPVFNSGDLGSTIARMDVRQGTTGDCWFLASVSAVSMIPEMIEFVVPTDNETNDAGVYHFRFWYEGAWVDVVVDDYVPCIVVPYPGPNIPKWTFTIGANFFKNDGQAEFWPMLLEKAYAKLNGSYSNIASNIGMNALENLIGGFGLIRTFRRDGKLTRRGIPPNLYEEIMDWFDINVVAVTGSSTPPAKSPDNNEGIVGPHDYSITGVYEVTVDDGRKYKLLRLRNPWGDHSWTGEWSDNSSIWNHVSESQKQDMGFKKDKKDDGEFWMGFDDYTTYFSDISACLFLNPADTQYQFAQFASAWSASLKTDGGWGKPFDNPHFLVDISADNGVLVTATLLNCKLTDSNYPEFYIRLFSAGQETVFDEAFFGNAKEIYPRNETEAPGSTMASFSILFRLPKGKYVVVPTSLHAGREETLCVRILNEGNSPAVAIGTGSGTLVEETSSRSRSNSASSTGSQGSAASNNSTNSH